MSGFPQHLENVKVVRCSDCQRVAPICGYWGPLQERRLCMPCHNVAWAKLLKLTGRLAEWKAMLAGRPRAA
jgi:hypothetical protein